MGNESSKETQEEESTEGPATEPEVDYDKLVGDNERTPSPPSSPKPKQPMATEHAKAKMKKRPKKNRGTRSSEVEVSADQSVSETLQKPKRAKGVRKKVESPTVSGEPSDDVAPGQPIVKRSRRTEWVARTAKDVDWRRSSAEPVQQSAPDGQSEPAVADRRGSPEMYGEYASSDPSEESEGPALNNQSGDSQQRNEELRELSQTWLQPDLGQNRSQAHRVVEDTARDVVQAEPSRQKTPDPRSRNGLSPHASIAPKDELPAARKIAENSDITEDVQQRSELEGHEGEDSTAFEADIRNEHIKSTHGEGRRASGDLETEQATDESGQPEPSITEIEMQEAPGDSSERQSSPNSVFDPASSPGLANHFPTPESGLKRKRDNPPESSSMKTVRPSEKSRRSVFSLSPPTSVEGLVADVATTKEIRKKKKTTPLSDDLREKSMFTKASASQPTLGSWAQTLSKDESLRHPIFNPASPRHPLRSTMKEGVVPGVASASPAKRKVRRAASKPAALRKRESVDGSTEHESSFAKDALSAAYSSRNGKKRADAPVDYYIPVKDTSKPREASPTLGDSSDYGEIATTVARRTVLSAQPGWRKRSLRTVDKKPAAEEKNRQTPESSSESDARSTDDESGHGSDVVDDETGVEEPDLAAKEEESIVCGMCHRNLANQRTLRRHRQRKGVHDNLHTCAQCRKTFYSKSALAAHEQRCSHDNATTFVGRKGHFSESEKRKLDQFRNSFCADWELDHTDFNDMMTESSRRSKDARWTSNFITKSEFLRQYYSVLPNRDRRSMHRFRERYFQNADSNAKWVEDDDDQLEALFTELGPKWVEIGQRLSRTQDAVSQRWRNKVQHRHKRNEGEWTKQETEVLQKAITTLKRRAGYDPGRETDDKISWSAVSNEIENVRTAQQCSNHWRALHGIKRGGFYVSKRKRGETAPVAKSKTDSKFRKSQEDSSMHRSGRKHLSKEYVRDSDEAEELDEDAESDGGGAEDDPDIDEEDEGLQDDSQLTILDSQSRQKSAATKRQLKQTPKGEPSNVMPNSKESETTALLTLAAENSVEMATPQLPPPRRTLGTKTPAAQKSLSLSQVFGQTQANTSALRDSAGRQLGEQQSQRTERPSPQIEMRLRPLTDDEGDWEDSEGDMLVADGFQDGSEEPGNGRSSDDDEQLESTDQDAPETSHELEAGSEQPESEVDEKEATSEKAAANQEVKRSRSELPKDQRISEESVGRNVNTGRKAVNEDRIEKSADGDDGSTTSEADDDEAEVEKTGQLLFDDPVTRSTSASGSGSELEFESQSESEEDEDDGSTDEDADSMVHDTRKDFKAAKPKEDDFMANIVAMQQRTKVGNQRQWAQSHRAVVDNHASEEESE